MNKILTLPIFATVIICLFFAQTASALSVVATIPVGSDPRFVAYDSGKGEIFVTKDDNTVSVISDATNTIVATIPVGIQPLGVEYDSAKGEIFVANLQSDTVSVIRDSDNTVVATIPVGKYPVAVAYDSGKGEIFVANSGSVSVISDSTNLVVATIPVSADGVAYDSAKGEIFVTNQGSSSVTVISDATNTIVATTGVGSFPAGVAYDSGKGEIFVVNNSNATVSVISDATNAVVATIGVGSFPAGVAYDSGKGEIFVANSGSISVISDATNGVLASIGVGLQPAGVAYDSGKGEIFVANVGDATLSVIEDTSNVKDTTAPVITPPPNQVVMVTTNSSGVTVYYPAPTATDNVGITIGPSCNPSSGSSFPVGVTTVTCTASNAAGHVGQATFTVTVQLQSTTTVNSAQSIYPQNTIVTTPNTPVSYDIKDQDSCKLFYPNAAWDVNTCTITNISITLKSGDSLTVETGITLVINESKITNHGTITNSGLLDSVGGYIDNSGGIINNLGTFNSRCGGTVIGNPVTGNPFNYTLCRTSTKSPKDEQYSAIEEKLPGFGTLFRDSTGRLNVYVTDPTKVTSTDKQIFSRYVAPGQWENDVVFLKGKQPWHVWAEWQRIAEKLFDQRDLGITTMGIDDKNQSLLIGFEKLDKTTNDTVNKFLTENQIPLDMVELIETGKIQPTPEFPLAIPILLISISSMIIFYRMKFKTR